MKFVQLIFWPGGAYTDATHANKAKIMIPYSDEIMNHDYIVSLKCIPNEPKTSKFSSIAHWMVKFKAGDQVTAPTIAHNRGL